MDRRTFHRSALALSAALPGWAGAQVWRPERNVEFVVPAGPGAALDTAARQIKELTDRLQLLPTPMIVTNRPGGAGMVAMGALQARPGDGHMLVTLTHSSINNKLVGEVALGYEDFTPLAILFDEFITVAVRADSPVRTGRDLAEALDIPLSAVTRRAEALSEVNPMLGMRGVRLGVVLPEIYAMQAQAIFEATVEVGRRGAAVVPEIMIPLVSARREVELVKSHVDAVAATVRIRTGRSFDYKLGVMVETPRAALRAGEIAQHASFLSFGTNDLTQMTYGLSRDDAGRFMNTYVQQGVFPEDPFHILDVDGVGELLLIGAERGRATRADLTLSICGEHGGNPESIAFCRKAGFDYVSCSPYRVPLARLAAAHLALRVSESRPSI
jgi:hypothetical protein